MELPVRCRVFDWALSSSNFDENKGWWKQDEVAQIKYENVQYLAADVIYDDELTLLLFDSLSKIIKNGEHLWIALEKRFNFSSTELSLVAHGYRRFLNIIGRGDQDVTYTARSGEIFQFSGKKIYLDFPQRILNYNRNIYLELWDVTFIKYQ